MQPAFTPHCLRDARHAAGDLALQSDPLPPHPLSPELLCFLQTSKKLRFFFGLECVLEREWSEMPFQEPHFQTPRDRRPFATQRSTAGVRLQTPTFTVARAGGRASERASLVGTGRLSRESGDLRACGELPTSRLRSGLGASRVR